MNTFEPQSHWKHGGTQRYILLNYRWVQREQQAVNTGCLNYETWFSYIVEFKIYKRKEIKEYKYDR